MSNSEEIKPVAFIIVELHLAEGIGQSVDFIFKITCRKHLGLCLV